MAEWVSEGGTPDTSPWIPTLPPGRDLAPEILTPPPLQVDRVNDRRLKILPSRNYWVVIIKLLIRQSLSTVESLIYLTITRLLRTCHFKHFHVQIKFSKLSFQDTDISR